MIRNMFIRVLGLCALTISAIPALGQTIDREMVASDKALEQRISIPCGHYTVGALLEMLTQQSSVVLKNEDPKDGGSGLEVTVCLKSLPLNEVMNSLYSLLSYKHHEWKWIRTGASGNYIYSLSRPLEARQLPQALKAWTQEALEKQAKKLIGASQLSPEELQEAAKTDSLLKGLLESPRMQDGIHEFATLLSPDIQMDVLRGSASPEFEVAQLDDRGKQWVHEIWKNSAPDGVTNPHPEPTKIKFYTRAGGLSPTMNVCINVENLGAYGYFGGLPLDSDFRDYFADLWLLPGDNAHTDLEMQSPMRQDEIVIKDNKRVMEERLGQLSAVMSLSFMARLPDEQRYDPHQIAGMPLEKFLRSFRGLGYELQSKWRGGTLLLTDDTLYHNDLDNLNPAPWIVVKRVRAMREHSQGLFVWTDLVELSHDYDTEMLERLSTEMPIAKALLAFNELLKSFYGDSYRTKKLFSKQGLPILLVQNLLTSQPFAHLLEPSATGKIPVSLRATETQSMNGTTRCNTLQFESLDETGAVIKKTAFYNDAR